MKFTDGYWMLKPEFRALYATEIVDLEVDEEAGTLSVFVADGRVTSRGDTLDRALLTVRYFSPAEGVIGVRITHFEGRQEGSPSFALRKADGYRPEVQLAEDAAVLRAGELEVRVPRRGKWRADFSSRGHLLTSSSAKSVAAMRTGDGLEWVHEQLSLDPGELVYGLGERFGPFTRNGQSVDIWNEDGGTASDLAYKNVPFYVTSKGYGVFADHPDLVSYEVGSEVVSRVQFSVAGSTLHYYVIDGPTPKDVLSSYTALTGRPARVPAWSLGLWLSTSFTTSYDEGTVTSLVEGMAQRDLPVSVFHFDCFWMRPFRWCDFVWDPQNFPDPVGMLTRLKAKGLRTCVWINPYIAQRSALFKEGAERGFLLRTTSGDIWQWDRWQAGMGLVDFTNPAAKSWYQDKLRGLVAQGVDAFKTDFGERIPDADVVWFDGSDPSRMHNYYTFLYNQAVFEVLRQERGEGEAVVFARSATVGGQRFPVHWGGDSDSTFASMAETLRGGLSLAMSGFGYWSHDIGGFEGKPDPDVFKRWLAFGLLSSHSRLHGSSSVRVPWAFDEEAVAVAREFARLKLRLMPYLGRLAEQASGEGIPMMRPMILEFPDDRGGYAVDTQYMLGEALCVSPVFRADGIAETYLPAGRWTHLLDGSCVDGPRWEYRQYDFHSLGLFVRPGTVLPIGAVEDNPEYAWAAGVTLQLYELPDGYDETTWVPGGTGAAASFRVQRDGRHVTVSSRDATAPWAAEIAPQGPRVDAHGQATVTLEWPSREE